MGKSPNHKGKNSHRSRQDEDRKKLISTYSNMSKNGLRVVAFAEINNPPTASSTQNIHGLTFIGFFGMKDTLRPEAKEAVEKTTAAGIKVVMITGDHELTALSIAKEALIYKEGNNILTGPKIDILSDEELIEIKKKIIKIATPIAIIGVNHFKIFCI